MRWEKKTKPVARTDDKGKSPQVGAPSTGLGGLTSTSMGVGPFLFLVSLYSARAGFSESVTMLHVVEQCRGTAAKELL